MTPLTLFSEPFARTGNIAGEGFRRLLGRPALGYFIIYDVFLTVAPLIFRNILQIIIKLHFKDCPFNKVTYFI